MIVGAILAFPLALGFTYLTEPQQTASDPIAHFQSLGPADQVFDAYERWQLGDATEAWFDFRRIVYFDVLLGEHTTETQHGFQMIRPLDGDIEIGLAFDDGSRTTLAVPAWGEVVALDDVLVVNFFGKPTLSCDDTAPEGECEETPLSFPPGSVITFGNPGHCWSAANACGPGGTITKLCSTSGTSACPLTMRDFAGEQLYLDHFDCGAAVTLVLDGLSAPRLVR